MMANIEDQFDLHSSKWWAARLNRQLDERLPSIATAERYYQGDHPLPEIPSRVKDKRTFERLLLESRSNWMKLVIDVEIERLFVRGFQNPVTEENKGDALFDQLAADIWEQNDLDVGAEQIHQEACLHGSSYALVAPGAEGTAIVTPEHPAEVIVACDPENRRKRLAGWKRWVGDDEFLYATLYLPERVFKLQSTEKFEGPGTNPELVPRVSQGSDFSLPNPFEVVQVVPFVNQPRMMLPFGVSDIGDLTDTQDRINELLFGMLVSAQYGAFRQRWVAGMQYQRDENNQPVFPFEPGANEVWSTGNAAGKFGEFAETTLEGYIKGIEAAVQHLAAQSRTPPHYLLGQSGAFPSGESLKSTETGLVAKVVQRQTYFSPSWRETMRLARLAANAKDTVTQKVLWKDPEARTLGELTDSLLKMAQLGVPWVVLWGKWGASPQEIAEWKILSMDQALELAATQPQLRIATVEPAPTLPAAA